MDYLDFNMEKAIFQCFVGGLALGTVAKLHGLPVSRARATLQSLAWQLQIRVGVIGVDETTTPTIGLIRQKRDDYLEALEHYVPAGLVDNCAECDAADTTIQRHIEQIARHSRSARRDIAMLLLLTSTAAKPIEIARLQVRDYLTSEGAIRRHSLLRAEIASGGKPRPLFFCTNATNDALDAYLAERVRCRHGAWFSPQYRGLDPDSPLFLTSTGQVFPVRRREHHGAQQWLCAEIHEVYRRILRHGATLPNTQSARRRLAHQLWRRGTRLHDIAELLGLQPRAVKKMLEAVPPAPAASDTNVP